MLCAGLRCREWLCGGIVEMQRCGWRGLWGARLGRVLRILSTPVSGDGCGVWCCWSGPVCRRGRSKGRHGFPGIRALRAPVSQHPRMAAAPPTLACVQPPRRIGDDCPLSDPVCTSGPGPKPPPPLDSCLIYLFLCGLLGTLGREDKSDPKRAGWWGCLLGPTAGVLSGSREMGCGQRMAGLLDSDAQ